MIWAKEEFKALDLGDARLEARTVLLTKRLALLRRARELGHAADYLIRCQHNRALPQGDKLWQRLAAHRCL